MICSRNKLFALALTAFAACLAAGPEIGKGKAVGNPAAPIRLELYSDFMCPKCKWFHENLLPAIIKDYVNTGKAYLISREFPLDIKEHKYSREAAANAAAAARIGKYDAVSDALFRNQSSWGKTGKVWDTVAAALSPDERKKVQTLAKDPAVLAEVQRDYLEATRLRLGGTPTMVISRGMKQQPWSYFDDYGLLRSYLDGLLKDGLLKK
jgi:protein-disulfide isomerase